MMKDMWNKRYATEEYQYGKEPNQFLKASLNKLEINSKILFPAEGEGRNAIYTATRGHKVSAFDLSEEGQKKALSFAKDLNVTIEYQVGEISELNITPFSFDAAALIFAHVAPPIRKAFHQEIAKTIKPGGIIILEGFSKNNLEYRAKNPSVGGPDKEELLFSTDIIKEDFPNFDVEKLEETETMLDEGQLHQGLAKVIRFIGIKRA